MAKRVFQEVLDAALNNIKNNANLMHALSAESTTWTEFNSTHKLADVAMASGDFTLAAGDTSGRKVTSGAKTGVTIDSNGTATHVGWGDSTNTLVKVVTTCTSQALNTGGTVDFPAWKYEINNPT